MTTRKFGTREEWLAARNELLAKEKELTRRGDQLAAERRDLPWVPIEKEYRFDTGEGPKTLPELFDGRSQLVVYHFMFGPAYTAGCVRVRGAGDERLRSRGRDRLPHLLDHCPRAGIHDGLLRLPRPRPARP
jgi:predicted dithiol-disulfide oxidoreductase (DUF899 family)